MTEKDMERLLMEIFSSPDAISLALAVKLMQENGEIVIPEMRPSGTDGDGK